MNKILDRILNTNSKIKILRLFISRREDFIATGRQIAKMTKISPPAAHVALKDLNNQDMLKREIVGRQHLYKLNINNRTVKNILIPAFKSETSVKDDIFDFLKKQIVASKLKNDILSGILYGSFQTGKTDEKSDVDVAVVTSTKMSKQRIEKVFTEKITDKFYEYFGVHLDVYVKTKTEFIRRLKKNLPPVSTLLQSYSVIYGKDPLDLK